MRVILTLVAALALAGPAFAGRAVSLRPDAASGDSVVTLGDLFDGAGAAARVTVAERTGQTVVLDAAAVQAAARRAGLDWDNPDGLRKIVVRAGLSAGSAAAPAAGAGAAHGNVQVLTYTRSLNAGEIVQPTDLTWVKVAAAPADSPTEAEAVIGQAAKRPLRAGAVVLARDVGAAIVIKPGDTVTVTYEADGISLSLEGKAMGGAGVGESLVVLNTQSKKTVQAMVTGPGQAVVGPAAQDIKTARSLRYAAR
ncbi:MAG TPA: flagellar basal body P-ring formation chaperone FlgA [Phenylobacterium sp.]|jgi:flagella basal body P-ring formation protein FlgA|uniref:flagellar basal body P-ring formation chaperone FlgA n=1 Tax=Phenylobacterium sp. TaxID=1871053 RepID=UPI002C792B4F|nr:flagellar basal body P-ring formation chaperone FlgA [Phenylobacterium sp.]HXA39221.1 flagellar basal body P-ring formation chaperone FlgA [Phenylobacterium sp.]